MMGKTRKARGHATQNTYNVFPVKKSKSLLIILCVVFIWLLANAALKTFLNRDSASALKAYILSDICVLVTFEFITLLAIIFAALLSSVWCIFFRPRSYKIDLERKELIVNLPFQVRIFDCPRVNIICCGAIMRSVFFFHSLYTPFEDPYRVLTPMERETLLRFSDLLQKAGGKVVCSGCRQKCGIESERWF